MKLVTDKSWSACRHPPGKKRRTVGVNATSNRVNLEGLPKPHGLLRDEYPVVGSEQGIAEESVPLCFLKHSDYKINVTLWITANHMISTVIFLDNVVRSNLPREIRWCPCDQWLSLLRKPIIFFFLCPHDVLKMTSIMSTNNMQKIYREYPSDAQTATHQAYGFSWNEQWFLGHPTDMLLRITRVSDMQSISINCTSYQNHLRSSYGPLLFIWEPSWMYIRCDIRCLADVTVFSRWDI